MDNKNIGNQQFKVNIREYKEDKDKEFVKKLEKKCDELDQSNQGITSFFTNLVIDDDPLRRITLFPLCIMLVAELQENGELVGAIRGCIKCAQTGFERRYVKLGSILGLRVSPKHRRMGIGSRLVETIEEWMIQNDAEHTFLATEAKNVASQNLFTLKYNYINLCSLAIYVLQVQIHCSQPKSDPSRDINIKKLPIDQAISFYNTRIGGKCMLYPADIGEILKEKMSLGTWLCYSKDFNEASEDNNIITHNSWAIFSIWNSFKYQNKTCPFHPTFKFLHSTLSHARKKIFPCLTLKTPFFETSVNNPLGFMFIYGVYGEGDGVGEIMDYVWRFASSLAADKGSNAIMIELGACDPIREHVPRENCVSCIEDLWYVKRVKEDPDDEEDELTLMRPLMRNVFVDPRDF